MFPVPAVNIDIFSEPDVILRFPVSPPPGFDTVFVDGYLIITVPEPPAPPNKDELPYPTKAGPPPPPPVFAAPACPTFPTDAAVSPPPPSPPVPAVYAGVLVSFLEPPAPPPAKYTAPPLTSPTLYVLDSDVLIIVVVAPTPPLPGVVPLPAVPAPPAPPPPPPE